MRLRPWKHIKDLEAENERWIEENNQLVSKLVECNALVHRYDSDTTRQRNQIRALERAATLDESAIINSAGQHIIEEDPAMAPTRGQGVYIRWMAARAARVGVGIGAAGRMVSDVYEGPGHSIVMTTRPLGEQAESLFSQLPAGATHG